MSESIQRPYCQPKDQFIINASAMKLPVISLVTPSFNQGRYIEQTLQSVLSQGYPKLEYIVIDGGSTDDSVNIILKHSSQLAYWISETDDGHGDALNKGFRHATGEIMGWLNSDDMLTPWSLWSIAEVFNTFPHVNWIHGTNSWWNSQGQMIGASQNHKNIYDYLIGDYEWIQQESVFWRKSLWEKAGGSINSNYRLMIDGELWSRFFLIDNLYTVDCILSGYRIHRENRAGNNLSECAKEMDRILEVMRTNCDDSTLSNADKIRKVLSWSKLKPIRNLFGAHRAQRILGKLFASNQLRLAAYNIISWDIKNNRWIETSNPFR